MSGRLWARWGEPYIARAWWWVHGTLARWFPRSVFGRRERHFAAELDQLRTIERRLGARPWAEW